MQKGTFYSALYNLLIICFLQIQFLEFTSYLEERYHSIFVILFLNQSFILIFYAKTNKK